MALARNSIFSFAPTLVGIVVSLVTVPLYISLAGAERYGALLIAWVMLGYFGQADFGLGRAITQRISSMVGAEPADRGRVVWSGLAGATAISAVGAALIYLLSDLFFQNYFDAEPYLKAEAGSAIGLFALCVPIIMYTGVSAGALIGLERFGLVSIGSTIGNLLSQLLPLLVGYFHSVELGWLLGASILGRVLGLLPIIAGMYLVFLRGQAPNPTYAELRRLFSYGVWIMVTALVSPFMTAFDRVVIGAVIGAAAVVAYSVPFQIAQRTVMFPAAVVQALFPRLAAQSADEAVALGRDAAILIGQVYAFAVIGLICLAEPLLQLWLGANLDSRSIIVGQIAMVGFWLNAMANVPYSHIQARGDSRFTALAHLVELPIYFAMLYALGTGLGLAGIALAFTARNLIDCVIMSSKAGFLQAAVLIKLAAPAALIAAAIVISPSLSGFLQSLAAGALLAGVLVPISWLQMPLNAKQALLAKLRRSPTVAR